LEKKMIQCVSAFCTFVLVILAILVMTRAISLDDVLKAAGKTLVLIMLLYFIACAIAPALHAGLGALAHLLMAAMRWIVVTVIVTTLLILVARTLLQRFSAGSQDSKGDL
jgi:putative effector of murein hydrolase LrgA (UPF0299 family)